MIVTITRKPFCHDLNHLDLEMSRKYVSTRPVQAQNNYPRSVFLSQNTLQNLNSKLKQTLFHNKMLTSVQNCDQHSRNLCCEMRFWLLEKCFRSNKTLQSFRKHTSVTKMSEKKVYFMSTYFAI